MATHEPLSRLRAFVLANAMLITFFISVTISVSIALWIGHYTVDIAEQHLLHLTFRKYIFYYDIPVGLLEIIIILWYERPIRRRIKNLYQRKKSSRQEIFNAHRRLLNEPFFLMGLCLVSWIGAAIFYYVLARGIVLQPEVAKELIVQSFLTAVIGVLATFFSLQFCIQLWLVPVLFPEGGLSRVTGVLRIKVSTRLAALFAATCLAPFFIIAATLYGFERQRLYGAHPENVLDQLFTTLGVELIVFSLMASALTALVAVNLSRPFGEIISVLHKIKNGRYDHRVRVVSNDEIGYTAEAINDMAAGLEEREQMRHSLSLAREVQQSLLPKTAPRVPYMDIAGKSLYCDETGGDFFDYILLNHHEKNLLGAVIGDVSGHGISAALLMTSILSLLRARTILPGDPGEIVNHLNLQIVRDTEETGQFVTLFYLEIQPDSRSLEWVRAGHDPAYLYRSATDSFETLGGGGSALGLEANSNYSTVSGQAEPGDVVIMTTDGIFETRGGNEMYGRERFLEVVRHNRLLSATEIRDAVLESVNDFRGRYPQEDDVTLVVIKFT